MPPVQINTGGQHVASGSPYVGEVSSIHNDHSIPDMLVAKLYPHRRPHHRSSRTSLNWAVLRSPRGREGHPVRLQFFTRYHGCPTPSPIRCPPILFLHVPHQQTKRHLLPALLSLDPSTLSLPVRKDFSLHPYPVRRLWLCPCCLAQAEDHANCLPAISPQTHTVKQADQGSKIPLKPSRVRRYNHVIVRV